MRWGWRSCRPLNICSLQGYICHKMFVDFMGCVLLLCLVRTSEFGSQCCAVTRCSALIFKVVWIYHPKSFHSAPLHTVLSLCSGWSWCSFFLSRKKVLANDIAWCMEVCLWSWLKLSDNQNFKKLLKEISAVTHVANACCLNCHSFQRMTF
jgi:hypothetical protein